MRLSRADYKELLGMLCPGCDDEWRHRIPEWEDTARRCWANRIRGKIDVIEPNLTRNDNVELVGE